jgi:hypothetical protein
MQQHLSTASPAESKSLITIRPKAVKGHLVGSMTNSKHANEQQLQVEGAFEMYRLHGGTKRASHGQVRQMLQ